MASYLNSSEPQGRQVTQVTQHDLAVPAEYGRQTVLPSIHVSTSSSDRKAKSPYGEDSTIHQLEDFSYVGHHLFEPPGVRQHHQPGSAPQGSEYSNPSIYLVDCDPTGIVTTQTQVSPGEPDNFQTSLHASEGQRALLPLLPLHGWLAQTMKEEQFIALQRETIDHDTVETFLETVGFRVGQEYEACISKETVMNKGYRQHYNHSLDQKTVSLEIDGFQVAVC
jgi:hypothetical protein